MKELFYKGNKIIQYGETDFTGFVFNDDQDIIEIKSNSLDRVQKKMDDYHSNNSFNL